VGCTLYILSYDVWFYLSHIVLHTRFHKIHRFHHGSDYNHMKYTDTYTGHYLETPFQGLGYLFPLLFIPFHLSQFIVSLILINLRGMARHDHRFIWLIGNHHILHHKHPKYNFGEYWLDRLFGTCYPNLEEYQYGLIYL
jgi:sterol desaturase/sphingolipid hydroxylase (fatty acid hydroxylase superfamily)